MFKQMICLLLLVSAASAQITVDLRTGQPAGTYNFPIAPVLDASYTKAITCYQHSEYFGASVTGDANTALCSATYRWVASASGTDEYYVELAAGGDPSLASTLNIFMDGFSTNAFTTPTLGSLKPGMCAYGDNDAAIAFSTWYCRTWDQIDPDSHASDAFITAVTGQGAVTKEYRSDCSYNNTTGVLECLSNGFLLYGFLTGDRILIQHADINADVRTWVPVTSKDSNTQITITAGLSDGNETNVKVFSHRNPFKDFRFQWSFPDSIYTFNQTDDRPQAAGTTISTMTFVGPIASPIFNTACSGSECASSFNFREEDYSLTVYDDLSGDSSSATTGTYTDSAWVGAREIYIDATSGTDVANCLTGVQSGCTSGAPCQTFCCGVAQLRYTVGAAILYVDRGETYALTTHCPAFSGDSDDKWVNGSGYGSGADPIITSTADKALNGTVSNLRVNSLNIDGSGGTEAVELVATTSLIYRLDITGGGQNVMDMDGVDWSLQDSYLESNSGNRYTLFAMGGDGISGHSVRRRAIRGNDFLSNGGTGPVVRIRSHSLLFSDNRSVDKSGALTGSSCLRYANDNHPNQCAYAARNYLYRESGTGTNGIILVIAQSGGSTNQLRYEDNFIGSFATTDVAGAFELSTFLTLGDVAFRNNVVWQLDRAWSLRAGNILESENNSVYLERAGTQEGIKVTGGNGYVRFYSINDIFSAPNATGSTSVPIENTGANSDKSRSKIHKSFFNFLTVVSVSFFKFQGDNDTPADYETASGCDIIGGVAGSAIDPHFADLTTKDMRLCTDTDVPVVGCVVSTAIDAGFDNNLTTSYNNALRPINTTYDIGSFEMDTATGRCYACDGVCTDDVTQAVCDLVMGDFDVAQACAGNAPTGACCTAVEGNCSVITDFCCDAAQWLTGDVCTDCAWKCCERDGTCSEVTEAVCGAFTNETFTWGSTCGTCATVACCTDALTCEDLTPEACAAESKLSGGGGSSCGVGDPCTALFPATTNARKSLLGVGR